MTTNERAMCLVVGPLCTLLWMVIIYAVTWLWRCL